MLGEVKVRRKKSQANLADLFTKNVGTDVIKTLLNQLTGYEHRDWIGDVPDSDWRLSERFTPVFNDELTIT